MVGVLGLAGAISGVASNWQIYACMRFLLGVNSYETYTHVYIIIMTNTVKRCVKLNCNSILKFTKMYTVLVSCFKVYNDDIIR